MEHLLGGSFKLSTGNFHQLQKIHVQFQGFVPPCVCLLLLNKTEKIYNTMNEVLGEEINLTLRMLLVLEQTLPALVESHFELFSEKLKTFLGGNSSNKVPPKNCKILQYVLKVLSQKTLLQLMRPLFPIEMRNQLDSAGEGVARTTNSVEGWQCGLQAFFIASTPIICLLLQNMEKLLKCGTSCIFKKLQDDCTPGAPVETKLQKQMQNIPSTFELTNAVPYFSEIANFR